MDPALPATLNEAIGAQPGWLRAWVMLLVLANLGGLLFVVGRSAGRWLVRPEPIAIVAGFVAAVVLMDWIYAQAGYVRLLGVAHLVCWGPAYAWVLTRRRAIGTASLFGKYIAFYLVVAGISLVIDVVDVVRYVVGDG